MADFKPPPRRREVQAAATRAAIITAADALFREQGYVATTMEVIAAKAGVAVQTIYNALGSKQALLSAVLDAVAAGPEAPRVVPAFMEERAARAKNGQEMVAVLADWFAEVHPRTAPVFRVLRQAAAVDAEAAELEQRRARQRLANYRQAAQRLADLAALRPGLALESAAAAIWAVGHPETYWQLVEVEGWPIERYREWVRDGLAHTLLPPAMLVSLSQAPVTHPSHLPHARPT